MPYFQLSKSKGPSVECVRDGRKPIQLASCICWNGERDRTRDKVFGDLGGSSCRSGL